MSGFDRRTFLLRGLTCSAAVFVAGKSIGECVDPDALTDSVQSMRESLEYTDAAPDPSKACSGCKYFNSVKKGDRCGNCEVLSTPVSATGHCDSWTKREGSG